MSEHKKLKSLLYAFCVNYIEQRINNIQAAIDTAAESGNTETKSSAGDKHETARAMMQLEQEKNAKQLQEVLELKKLLDKIDPAQYSKTVTLGSIVITNEGNFYISISAGKIKVDDKLFFAISPASPIGNKLMGMKANQEIAFNGKQFLIKDVI